MANWHRRPKRGVQGVFQHVGGVTGAVSGYAGGQKSTADYETVGVAKATSTCVVLRGEHAKQR